MAWEIEFFEHPDTGKQPARDWLDGLDEDKRLALIAAIEQILEPRGIDVCESEWGKNLGSGLYEFRIRHNAEEIRAMFPAEEADQFDGDDDDVETDTKKTTKKKSATKILLRVFFHAYGEGDKQKIVLLVNGYDKGRSSSSKKQQTEIEKARDYLKRWKLARQEAKKSAQKQGERPPQKGRGRRK